MTSPHIIKLRPHHIVLCLQTYSGAGYSDAFVQNMTAIAQKMNEGAGVQIVQGPDDICAPMIKEGDNFHCEDDDTYKRDRLALQACGKALGRQIAIGDTINLSTADWQKMRAAYKDGSLRQGCIGCPWQDRCDESAGMNFTRSKMRCGL